MPTMLPARPDATALAERPATPGALVESFVATAVLGVIAVSGVTALVTAVAGPLPFAFSIGELIGRTVLFTGLAFGALSIGETKAQWSLRATRPLAVRRRHPATWATLALAAFVLAGVLRGSRHLSGEFQRVERATVPLGVTEARARARPDDPLAQFALGVAYARAERFADADEPLRRAVELAPRAGIVHEWYAWTRSRLGDPRQAVAEYRLARANHDPSPSVENGLARNLIMSGAPREAELISRRYLASDAHDPTWLELLAWSLERQPGRTTEAIRALEEASRYDHDNAWVEAMLGYTYRSKADFKTAITHFERAWKLRPDVRIGYELGATKMLVCDLAGADSAFAMTDARFPHAIDEVPPAYRVTRANAATRDPRAAPGCGATFLVAPQRR